jgi:phosphoribosylformylglycinamidine synthase subunit PurL
MNSESPTVTSSLVTSPVVTSQLAAPAPTQVTPELLAQHSITPDEYQSILSALGRVPSLTELGIYSVMWSEHCSYKSSRVHLRRLPTKSDRVVQGPGENAGIIDVGDGWGCAFKIESHNHPSYIEPFQGAATGVGGILRDIFTMNARPFAVMDSLRFGPISAEESPETPPEVIHKNHSIMEGVVSGIAGYGNCFGVPNLGGETRFEPCYSGNPLVNAFALGLVRLDEIFYARATGIGNPVIYVGAKTGRDGIHGATMASEEFKEGSEQKRPNVQMGDPFMEKLLLEACLEAMKTGAVLGIQDMGAAGLTCSACEMGARGGVGVEIELDHIPQRETGMSSYEIMLSESQERMLLVAEKGREKEILDVFAKWGLDATIAGQVISENRMRVWQHGVLVANIPNESLTDDAPLYHRPVGTWRAPVPLDPPAEVLAELSKARDYTADLKKLLASSNICSKRWVFEQYDSMVQTNTVQGPGGEAGVMRIKGSGTPGRERGLAMALAGNSRWCYLDPKLGAMHAVAEAARKVACTGATPVAATNCLNFGNPEKPEIMAQLSAAIDGIGEACTALGTPITGGNVSLYNETRGEGIYPTPVIGIVGIIDDVARAVPGHFTRPDENILVWQPYSADYDEESDGFLHERTLGSSQFAATIFGELWGTPPGIALEYDARIHAVLKTLVDRGLVSSISDLSDGGLAVALAEASFPAGLGARITIGSLGHGGASRNVSTLFGESACTILITCQRNALEEVEGVIAAANLGGLRGIGVTQGDSIEILSSGESLVSASVADLKAAWSGTFDSVLTEVHA